jgi:hypothetical protein
MAIPFTLACSGQISGGDGQKAPGRARQGWQGGSLGILDTIGSVVVVARAGPHCTQGLPWGPSYAWDRAQTESLLDC